MGQKGEGGRNGLGLFYWNCGDTYFGRYEKGDREGIGIYIARDGYTINNCDNGTVYVGEWKNNKKHGTGTVYDKNGKLIYYGKFLYDKPTGKYPTQGSYSAYTFEIVNYSNGCKYVGELKNGERSGKGIFIWTAEQGSGIFWYGSWENGIRDGYGIYVYGEGNEYITGRWKGDNKL